MNTTQCKSEGHSGVKSSWCLLALALLVPFEPASVAAEKNKPGDQRHAVVGGVEAERRWVNLPGAPLQFSNVPNLRYFKLILANSSAKEVSRYQLACGIERGGRMKVLHKLPPRDVRLEPNIGAIFNPIGPPYEPPYIDKSPCRSPDAKFFVVSVRFADGSSWEAPAPPETKP